MICPYCGAQSKDDKPKFCPSCGKTVTHAADAALAASTTPGVLAAGQEEIFFDGRPAAVGTLGALLLCILTVGLAYPILWIRARGTHYKLTSQRVIVETGLFGKRVDQLDLYRIVDFVVERSFGQRVMGTGDLTIDSMDKTTPITRIAGIRTNVMGLYERVRGAAEVEKQKRLVRPMDIEHPI